MRTIIAGSRDITDEKVLFRALLKIPWDITVVLCGMAKGADALGFNYGASMEGVALEKYPAKWEKYGRSAGYKRNIEIAENADALVALWDGKSKGTKHMIDIAISNGLIVYVHKEE